MSNTSSLTSAIVKAARAIFRQKNFNQEDYKSSLTNLKLLLDQLRSPDVGLQKSKSILSQ